MSEYHIGDFSEIDFVNIDASRDCFVLPGGEKYMFSDDMCDHCWTGGTVLEFEGKEKQYYCVLCQNKLKWVEILNDFLRPKGDKFKFLLPIQWSQNEIEKWYDQFKQRRLAEEQVRKQILEHGK